MKPEILSIVIRSFVLCCALMPAHGEDNGNSGIQIRIHVPCTERLANENYHNYIVRIENRSQYVIPVLTTLTYIDDGRDAPIQFRFQTPQDADSGRPARFGDWATITQQAEPSNLRNTPSFLEGGQAIELIMAYAPVGTLPDGASRIACQIGPDQTIYSNWVDIKTQPAEDTANWPILAVEQLAPGQLGIIEFIVDTEVSGQWLFARRAHMKEALTRICLLPHGESPTIECDMNKHQAAIVFQNHPEATIFFNATIGISRSTPWPDKAKGIELSGTPIPVDAPSPLEFPRRLFAATADSLGSPAIKPTPKVQSSYKSNTRTAYFSPKWLWTASACALFMGGWVLLLLIRARKN